MNTLAIDTADATAAHRQLTVYAAAVYDADDVVEVRRIKAGADTQSEWVSAAELPDLAGKLSDLNGDGWNVYAGANPRRAAGLRGDESIDVARCAFADFDHTTVDDALVRLAAARLPTATLVLASGHGCHCYWRLAVPCADLAEWSDLQKDLADFLKSDRTIFNPERIMRLPAFLNHKKDPSVSAEIVFCDATRRTAFDDLRAAVPARPQPDAVRNSVHDAAAVNAKADARRVSGDNRVERCRRYLAKCRDAISGDHGHDATLHWFCECLRFGLDDAETLAVIGEINLTKTGGEPWSEKEMLHKLEAAHRKVKGSDFGCRLREDRPGYNGNGKAHGANGRSVDIDTNRKTGGESGISSTSTPRNVSRNPPPPYEPFPLDVLPEPLRSYVTASAVAIVCDPALVALPLLAAATAAVGNSRRIMLKRNWTEPPVAWVVTVVYSGGLKSAAQDHGVRFTLRRQRRLFKDHEAASARHAEQVKAWKALPKDQRGEEPDPPPPCERVRVSDITVEALADRLAASPRGVLLARDELAGFFASLNQYKGGKGSDCSNYLEMHGAREIVVDRKTGDRKTLRVDQAAVSITGTIQPGALRRALTPEFFDNGMAARFLVAYPPKRQKEWSEDEVDPALEQRVVEIFDALFALAPERDHDGDPVPKDLPLSFAAKDLWIDFVNEVGREQVDRHDEDLAAAWSKLEGYGARLALVLHLVRVAAGDDTADPYRIDDLSMASGIRLARWFGQETERVYAALRETEDERGERELCEVIRAKGGTMTPRALMRCCRRYATSEAAERALQELVEAKRGRWVLPASNGKPGRPADRYFELVTAVDVDTNTESPVENGNSVNVNAGRFSEVEGA